LYLQDGGKSKGFSSFPHFIFPGVKRLSKTNVKKISTYPDVITSLPEAKVACEGGKAWILQAESTQLVFFQFENGADMPAHSHIYTQWGMVIDGEMELTIDGKPQRFKKGDEYLVPAGKSHSARFFKNTRVMDYFSEKNRYEHK
jgi:quercetin dioxygenase-like cupin family protein